MDQGNRIEIRHIRPKKSKSFTIYDLRFAKFGERSSRAAKQMRAGCDEAVIGRDSKAAGAADATRWQTEPAYVRFTRRPIGALARALGAL